MTGFLLVFEKKVISNFYLDKERMEKPPCNNDTKIEQRPYDWSQDKRATVTISTPIGRPGFKKSRYLLSIVLKFIFSDLHFLETLFSLIYTPFSCFNLVNLKNQQNSIRIDHSIAKSYRMFHYSKNMLYVIVALFIQYNTTCNKIK